MMHRSSILRLAAVLSLAAFAACDTPTANTAAEARSPSRRADFLPVATVTVTNSGGFPLVSWGAVAGATSYTVNLITYNTVNGAYQSRSFTFLTSTTGTSYLDSRPYTGVYQCDGPQAPDGSTRGHWYEYEVVSVFPTGTSSARHYAPIANALCRVR